MKLSLNAHFVFISHCPSHWGGSEELWAGAALTLARKGYHVAAFKTVVDKEHPRIIEAQLVGVYVENIQIVLSYLSRMQRKIIPKTWSVLTDILIHYRLFWRLRKLKPMLVVISQGQNFDALHFVNLCRRNNLSYALISQKASDSWWPEDDQRSVMRQAFLEASRCFFVSQHNLSLTEMQIGIKLENAELVRNPYLTVVPTALPWPETDLDYFRLACVARLDVVDKGQDILLRVLAQEKWKQRHLHVSFFGKGINFQGLVDLADWLGLKAEDPPQPPLRRGEAFRREGRKVSFLGFTEDVISIWRSHHALVLPSRREGLPLALVEAMMCGRASIVTDVGGNSEIIEDNVTGFLARGADFNAFDEALERAWIRRHEWEQIGHKAAQRIRELVPPDPAAVFASKLVELVGWASPTKPQGN